MRVSDYFRLLAANRFRIEPTRWPMTGLCTVWSVFNSGLAAAQQLVKGRAIEATELPHPPIFIVGHWRSGTTLLHELIATDSNLTFPGTYNAFVPHHFLVSGFAKWLTRFLVPERRPFDDMTFGLDTPQEDDFAIMMLGAATYYERMGFPMQADRFARLLDWQNLEPNERKQVDESIRYFFKALTLSDPRQLVVKSPPHTGRLGQLLTIYPEAKFVHISRHPHKIVPSTMRMWRINDDIHGFQRPRYDDEHHFAHISRSQQTMYGAYLRDRDRVPANQLAEVSFEDLTASPEPTIRRIYSQLELSNVDEVVDATNRYFNQDKKGYRKNKHQADHLFDRINTDWSEYMNQFGYS